MVADVALGGRKRLAPMMYFPGNRSNAASALDLNRIMQRRVVIDMLIGGHLNGRTNHPTPSHQESAAHSSQPSPPGF